MTAANGKLIKGATGDWEVVIGMEVHAQVTSKSKLFSGASTAFGGEPNSHVSLVDAAMPGMLHVDGLLRVGAVAPPRVFVGGHVGIADCQLQQHVVLSCDRWSRHPFDAYVGRTRCLAEKVHSGSPRQSAAPHPAPTKEVH